MTENPLMSFLTKRAYTPWVDNELPEITNSDSWEDFSYDPEVLANHEHNAKLNALKRALGPEAWNKFVNNVNYKYRGQPNEHEIANFLKAYNIQNGGPAAQASNLPGLNRKAPTYERPTSPVVSPGTLPQVTVHPFDTANNILSQAISGPKPEEAAPKPAVTAPAIPGSALTGAGGADVSLKAPTVDVPEFNTTPKPATAPTPAPNPAAVSPSLPGSALTGAGGANVNLQAPTIDIPEFNTTPKPAPVPSLPGSALTGAGGANVNLQAPTIDIPEFNPTPEPAVTAPAISAPASQATQNPSYNPKAITREQMQQFRRHTGATDMNSDMDRWKTYQAMNGNRNVSNADYYAAKRNNALNSVKAPLADK